MIFLLTVGTSKYKFERFFDHALRILPRIVKYGDVVYIQYGFNSPVYFQSDGVISHVFSFVSVDEFSRIISSSDQVISHGAAGSIMQCNEAGIKPLVLCRSSQFLEHSDDHQRYSSKIFSDLGLCQLSKDLENDCLYLKGNNIGHRRSLSGAVINKYISSL